MSNYLLTCDSTVDLTREHLQKRNIPCIGFPFELDGKHYIDDLGQIISSKDFYGAMANGAMTRTAQINTYEFEEFFEPFLKEGKDVVHLLLSSGITGALASALIAQENLKEKYPERNIYLIDSLAASSGEGLLVDKLADLRDEGMTAEELYRWAEENKRHVQHWFFSTDLQYYIRGGRISKTAGTVGTVLGICPLMNVSHEGKLIPREKIRPKKRVIKAIVDKMELTANNGLDYDGPCYISHSDCLEDARQVADLIETRFPNLAGKVRIFNIGPVIGSHTGPGTVALFYWGEARVD